MHVNGNPLSDRDGLNRSGRLVRLTSLDESEWRCENNNSLDLQSSINDIVELDMAGVRNIEIDYLNKYYSVNTAYTSIMKKVVG